MSIRTVARGPSRLLAAAVAAVTIAATVAVTGLSGTAAAADPLISQGKPATASSTENAGTPAVGRRRRQHRHPLVQRVQRSAVDPGRPRRHRHHQPGRPATGRPRTPRAFQIQTSANGTDLDHDLLAPPPAPAASRPSPSPAPAATCGCTAPPGPPATATRCGSSRSTATIGGGSRLRHRQRGAGPARPPPPRPRTPAPRPRAAVDGNAGTRWSSAFSDPQWLQVDLGAAAADLPGRADTGRPPTPRRSRSRSRPTATTWTDDLHAPPPAPAARRPSTVTGTGRYVRMYGTARATGYGYSLWEFGRAHRHRRDPRRPTDPDRRPSRRRRARPERASSSTRPCPARRSRAQLDTDLQRSMESNQFGTAALRAAVQAGHLQRVQRPDRLLHLDRRPRPEPRRRAASTAT